MNARTMNVKKNISAAPRSRIKNSSATQTTQKIIYFVSERVVCNLSRVAAPTKTNATLTNSDGWMDIPPILNQLNAPFILRARIRVKTSRPIAATPNGIICRWGCVESHDIHFSFQAFYNPFFKP